jgi:hypothetical protein
MNLSLYYNGKVHLWLSMVPTPRHTGSVGGPPRDRGVNRPDTANNSPSRVLIDLVLHSDTLTTLDTSLHPCDDVLDTTSTHHRGVSTLYYMLLVLLANQIPPKQRQPAKMPQH